MASDKLRENLCVEIKVELLRKIKWQLDKKCFLQVSNQLHLPLDFRIGGRLGTAIQIQLWNDFTNE